MTDHDQNDKRAGPCPFCKGCPCGAIAALRAERDTAESKALAVHEVLTKERDAALARVKEVEKEWDESRAAQRSMISELQAAMCDVFQHLGPPTDRYTPWREQVIAAIDEVTAERDALKDDNERLRGAMAASDERLSIAAKRVGMDHHGCDAAEWMADALEKARQDNERLRELIAGIRVHEPALLASLWKKVLAVVDERNAAMRIDQELGQ